MKVIAFSLWGDNPKYNVGAIKNAELAKVVYPGWVCRFYVGASVPQETICFGYLGLLVWAGILNAMWQLLRFWN